MGAAIGTADCHPPGDRLGAAADLGLARLGDEEPGDVDLLVALAELQCLG